MEQEKGMGMPLHKREAVGTSENSREWVLGKEHNISTSKGLFGIFNSTMHSFQSIFFLSFFPLKAHSACVVPFCLFFPHVFEGFPIVSMFLTSPVSTLQILTNPLVFWLIVIDIVHRVFRCCAITEKQKWQSST